jgi:hypothetical protein
MLVYFVTERFIPVFGYCFVQKNNLKDKSLKRKEPLYSMEPGTTLKHKTR